MINHSTRNELPSAECGSGTKLPIRIARAAILAFVFLAVVGVSVFANSRLTVSNPEFDFGFVPTNCDVSYVYWLHSTGSSNLHIEWTDASCPCAALPLTSKIIEPGDSVGLELLFTTGRVAGAITRKPYIKTNADFEPERTKFSAKVIPGDTKLVEPLGIMPFRADLSSIGKFHQDTARIVFYNNSELPMELSMLYSRPEFFSVLLPESIKPQGIDTCLVILNRESPEAVEAAFAKSFTVETALRRVGENSLVSRFTIPVRRKYSPAK
jgi:Protein of unknown function (DUF1573)